MRILLGGRDDEWMPEKGEEAEASSDSEPEDDEGAKDAEDEGAEKKRFE